MDIWSDPNRTPFMAITAHWIESVSDGSKTTLKLCADLIGFQQVHGCHVGEHLAQAFLFITDCLNITNNVSEFLFEDDHSEWPEIIRSSADEIVLQIQWIMLDNASNNDTFMASMERLLGRRGIQFHHVEQRIR